MKKKFANVKKASWCFLRMLSKKQILEIREHLERAQNPVFFYDNDADGLCSYVLLRRLIGRGKGVAVRSHPDVDEGYAKKAQELNADYIFVLDRPVLGERFVEEISKLQLPIVWIDHHDLKDEKHSYKDFLIQRKEKIRAVSLSVIGVRRLLIGKKMFGLL